MLSRFGAGRQHELRIDRLPPGPVHAVGAASLEVASMVRYLVEQGRDDIVLHDLAPDFRAAFEQAHKLQSPQLQARSWAALSQCTGGLRAGPDYLTGVEHAAGVLIPVAWFLHRVNDPLRRFRHLFVTWPDTCFDLNHEVDHGNFATYRQTKYSMASACERFLYPAGLPRQWPDAAEACSRGQSFGRHGDFGGWTATRWPVPGGSPVSCRASVPVLR